MTAQTVDPYVLRKGSQIQLNADDPDSVFTVTQAEVTFNGANHITGQHEVNVMVVLERSIPKGGR